MGTVGSGEREKPSEPAEEVKEVVAAATGETPSQPAEEANESATDAAGRKPCEATKKAAKETEDDETSATPSALPTSGTGSVDEPKHQERVDASQAPSDVAAFDLSVLEAEIAAFRENLPPYVSHVGSLTVPALVCDDNGQLEAPPSGGLGPWDVIVTVRGGQAESETGGGSQAAPDSAEKKESREAAEAAEPTEESREAAEAAGPTGTVATEALAAAEDAEEVRAEAKAGEAYDFPYDVVLRFDALWPRDPPTVRFKGVIHHAFLDDSGSMLLPFYRTLPREDTKACSVRLILAAIHDFLIDPLKSWGIPRGNAPKRLIREMLENEKMNHDRLSTIRKYGQIALHKELFESPMTLREDWFDADLWRAHSENTPEAWRAILTDHLSGEVLSFKMFTDKFCDMLVEEIFNFYSSGLPARRPNSMNNYGIILNEIGLEPMINRLQEMLQPLGQLLWPGPGSVWDGHHCFIVRYREGEDLGLDMHTDDSDVTFNICLGLDFAGAGLQFCGMLGAKNHRKHSYVYKHAKGTCVCHLGRKRHGADDISSGERLNLILWNHSSTYRESDEYQSGDYQQEDGPPDEVCLSYTHDRDYGVYKSYPKGKESFKGRGWCPPKKSEYEDFKPDSEEELRS